MKKYILSVVSGLVLLLALGAVVVFFTGQQSLVAASQPEKQETAVAPYEIVAPTVAPEKVQEVADLVQDLKNQVELSNKKYLKPGWFHASSKVKNGPRSPTVLPNGVTLPDEYIMDDWYLLDKNRIVTSAVTFMRALDGSIIQYTVLYNGSWYNKTLNDVSPARPFFTPSLDDGFSERAAHTPQNLSKKNEKTATSNLILYVTHVDTKAPVVIEGNSFAAKRMIERAEFGANGEGLLKLTSVFVLEDGTEILDSMATTLVCENVAAPSVEVAKILAQVKK